MDPWHPTGRRILQAAEEVVLERGLIGSRWTRLQNDRVRIGL